MEILLGVHPVHLKKVRHLKAGGVNTGELQDVLYELQDVNTRRRVRPNYNHNENHKQEPITIYRPFKEKTGNVPVFRNGIYTQ